MHTNHTHTHHCTATSASCKQTQQTKPRTMSHLRAVVCIVGLLFGLSGLPPSTLNPALEPAPFPPRAETGYVCNCKCQAERTSR